MDAAEVEFLAEKELVTIIPNFSLDKIYLIGVRAGRLPQAPAPGKGRSAGAYADARLASDSPRGRGGVWGGGRPVFGGSSGEDPEWSCGEYGVGDTEWSWGNPECWGVSTAAWGADPEWPRAVVRGGGEMPSDGGMRGGGDEQMG